MSDWHISFGMGEDSGGFLSWGFDYVKKIVEGLVGGLKWLAGIDRFTWSIKIKGNLLKPIVVEYKIVGTLIDTVIEKIVTIGSLIKPFFKGYEIKGKRGIKEIIEFLIEDED